MARLQSLLMPQDGAPSLTSLIEGRRERMKQSKLAELLAGAYSAPDDQRQRYIQDAIRTDPAKGFEMAKMLDPRFQQGGNEAFTLGPGAKRFGPDGKVIAEVPFAPDKPEQPKYTLKEYGGVLYYVPESPMVGQQSPAMPQSPPENGTSPQAGNTPAADAGFDILRNAVEWQESRGNPNAVSPAGAVGRMQTMPGTLRDPGYGVAPARDNSDAEMTRVGNEYLRAMTEKYGQVGGLAAYNWGPGNWERALQQAGGDPQRALAMAPKETQSYVPNVLGRAGNMGGMQENYGATASGAIPAGAIPVPGIPRAAPKPQVETLNAQEVASLGLPAGSVVQRRADGSLSVVNKPAASSGSGAPELSAGEAKTVRQNHRELKDALGMFKAFDQALKDTPNLLTAGLDGKTKGRLGTAYSNARSAIRVLYNTGVLQPGELPMLEQALRDPNGMNAADPRTRDIIRGQLDELYRLTARAFDNLVHNYPQLYNQRTYDGMTGGGKPAQAGGAPKSGGSDPLGIL